jgi:DNA replication protein DnaC
VNSAAPTRHTDKRYLDLIGNLAKAQQQVRLEVRPLYGKRRLQIIDELGHLPLEPHAGPLFFQLISRRYE